MCSSEAAGSRLEGGALALAGWKRRSRAGARHIRGIEREEVRACLRRASAHIPA
jgi:hypothetical protein